MLTQLDAIDYLILTQVRSANHPCFFLFQRRSPLGVGPGEPNERIKYERRHAAVYFWSDE